LDVLAEETSAAAAATASGATVAGELDTDEPAEEPSRYGIAVPPRSANSGELTCTLGFATSKLTAGVLSMLLSGGDPNPSPFDVAVV